MKTNASNQSAKLNILSLIFAIVFNTVHSNTIELKFTNAQPHNKETYNSQLKGLLKDFQIVSIDKGFMRADIIDGADSIFISFDSFSFRFSLRKQDIRSNSYRLRTSTEDGIHDIYPGEEITTYRGNISGQSLPVCATVANNYMAFSVPSGRAIIIIEPLCNLIDGCEENLFILYRSTDNPTYQNFCEESKTINKKLPTKSSSFCALPTCKTVEISWAADDLLYKRWGNNLSAVNKIENCLLTILNMMDAYFYSPTFNLKFKLKELYISAISNEIVPASTLKAQDLIDAFALWAPTKFVNNYDLAGMWTYRDFYGATPSATGVAGVAYDDGICDSQYKYHVCELSRPGATINLSLITITHEIGHNFSAIHVSSPATAIMNSTSGEGNVDWDSGTISLISNKINSAACLNDCSLHTPEVYFEADKKYGCNNLTVNFKDKSDFNPTSWSWNFGDGTPNSSMQNPTHTFNSPGLYNVTLTASNANGSSTSTMTGFIQVGVGSYPVTQVIPVTKTSGTGGYHVNTTTAWMTFDAITDLEIVALDIDAQTAGPRWFYLAQDTGHKILESKVVNLNAGLQKVYFNWKVPQGSKYNLAVSYGKGTDWYNQLYRLSSGVSLPKTIPGLINVNSNFPLDQGNTAGASAWYIGFNWEVRGVCSSSTGIFDNENSSEINIFPNPAIDLVIIKLTDKNYSQIKVFDTKGSVVNCEISENEGEIMLNVANWQSGIYLTEIIYPNGRIIKRKLNVVNP